ncbi:uncharacterized protein CTHT_0011810 [Thermochaetoides thermophila DSM 1495]|uniref:Kinetochore protein Sos7 coiled-coil domain-containing protein n=1 Tax=Chaetomium thermophilum (strain DSM 1495 / CBS 144.50 / IMI 039719) TaxID=759272 RepID=G0S0Z7_CHATD|nr:hypothetical protein CTHT_0011810 [Thermochaetoides thermophila DSM 1495]EGS22707.1 hypothetical protein CTHT_0011810 [Thermochaetoides thermophila DSM 1495]
MASPNNPSRAQRSKALHVAAELQDFSNQDFTIIGLSEPIFSALSSHHSSSKGVNSATPRTSDISNVSDSPTPSSLEADLSHYKELFSKLRFSYVEQVTKEKFIRAIVGDPPLIVSSQENATLEEINASAKSMLQELKTEVSSILLSLEERSQDLATRYERVKAETALLVELLDKIPALENRIAELQPIRRSQGDNDHSGNPDMNLPLGKTLALVDNKRRELGRLDRQLELLGPQVLRKSMEQERLQSDVLGLENRKSNSIYAAKEAKKNKEDVRGGDDLESNGRWHQASVAVLSQLLTLEE